MKALAERFQRYFHIGVMCDPDPADLQALGIEEVENLDLPILFTLIAIDSHGQKEPTLNAVFYEPHKMGELNYPNILKYFFHTNSQFRITLPGENLATNKEAMTMRDVLEIEKVRFDIKTPDGELLTGQDVDDEGDDDDEEDEEKDEQKKKDEL